MKSNCFALIAALALIGIVSPGYSEDYTITDLGTLGGIYSYPTGINAKGEVTGVLKAVSGVSYPFIYNGQTMLNLGTRNRSHPPSLATFEARDYSGGGDGGDRWRG